VRSGKTGTDRATALGDFRLGGYASEMPAKTQRLYDSLVAFLFAAPVASCNYVQAGERQNSGRETAAAAPERTPGVPGASANPKPREAATSATIPSTAPGSATAAAQPSAECPLGMLLVDGEYCPVVEQTCMRWLDPPGSRYATFRCAEYARPSVCKAPRTHKRFCIDRTERTEAGSRTPKNFVSFHGADALCKSIGARVCRESEWQFACEGPEMRPYPYGFSRDANACNTDISQHLKENGRLKDHRAQVGSHPGCASPFGVMDLAGNMEEWVAADGNKFGWKELLKGSWWIPSRHACRQYQIGHGPTYSGAETGTRCCKDAESALEKTASTPYGLGAYANSR
jgi:formylglycine-generating enzyme